MRATLLTALVIAALGIPVAAQETGHYPAGVEGIKAASIPGPGQYLKWYNIYYEADAFNDRNGKNIPGGFDAEVLATAPRLIWITEEKAFGADYGFDLLIPVLYTDLAIPGAGITDSMGGVGDLYVEPLMLGWHGDRYDIGAAAGFWAPTGNYNLGRPASPGKDYWTGMFTLGSTLYLDEEKTWSAAVLGRYETNSVKNHIDIRPGDNFHIEWGVAKNFEGKWDVGVSGYCYWQVTDDGGTAVTYDRSVHDRFFSIGPEVNYFDADKGLGWQLRYQFDFGAIDHPQGRNLVLNVVKVIGKKKDTSCALCR